MMEPWKGPLHNGQKNREQGEDNNQRGTHDEQTDKKKRQQG